MKCRIRSENKLLLLFMINQLTLIFANIVSRVFHPSLKNSLEGYIIECLFPFITLLFILGAFFVNEKNIKLYRISCILLMPIWFIFGEAGMLTYSYIEDILYVLNDEGKDFRYIIENSDLNFFFTVLSFAVSIILNSVVLMNIAECISKDTTVSKIHKPDGIFIKSALLYSLFTSSGLLHTLIVRADALNSSEGVVIVLMIGIPNLLLAAYIISIITAKNRTLIKALKISFIIIAPVAGIFNMLREIMHTYNYVGIYYRDWANLLNIISSLCFYILIGEIGEYYFNDKINKKAE